MTRTNRIALLAALALLVIAAGTALANRGPVATDEPALLSGSHAAGSSQPPDEADEADEVERADDGDDDALRRAVDRLADRGVDADAAQLAALAERYGVGGAVRLLAWSAETGRTVEEIALMRDGDGDVAPMGWGQIAHDLGVHPGLGSIMGGGNGHGNGGDPPGLERKPDSSAGD